MASETPKTPQKDTGDLVLQVTGVTFVINKTNPPTLQIGATGVVRSGGYTNPQLDAHHYLVPPADGIYAFNFLADAPTGPATQALQPITAEPYLWSPIPEGLKGVRICGVENNLVYELPTEHSLADGGGSGAPRG